jgi:hypothetical protein
MRTRFVVPASLIVVLALAVGACAAPEDGAGRPGPARGTGRGGGLGRFRGRRRSALGPNTSRTTARTALATNR